MDYINKVGIRTDHFWPFVTFMYNLPPTGIPNGKYFGGLFPRYDITEFIIYTLTPLIFYTVVNIENLSISKDNDIDE